MMTRPIALYVHWPFCRSKCAYCAFNSVVRVLSRTQESAWVQAFLSSFDWHIQHILEGHTASYRPISLFFGGGTPSLLQPESLQQLISHMCALWSCQAESLEITLEANPETLTEERLQAFSQAGVNRLSLGIQALHPQDLAMLGRRHSLEQALQAVAWARNHIPNYNLDFIYHRPRQSLRAWRQELQHILALDAPHLSLYELTWEPGTPFALHQKELPATAAFFNLTHRVMQEAGYTAYEISNFCTPAHFCRHNLAYWRYQEYLGIGPGAHSRVEREGQRWALAAFAHGSAWRTSVARGTGGLATQSLLSPREQLIEHLCMGLRLEEGLCWDQLEHSAGPTEVAMLRHSPYLQKLQTLGVLLVTQQGARVSQENRAKVDGVLRYLDL
ncbi:MAG: radical SAM family heme chaperone HemW [Holosporales bacterium]|nr:radical SAM family heme chaperone HemW [Holosporales bacterium]